MFSTRLENFLPFSSNLKLSSANSSSLWESKICRLEKGQSNTSTTELRRIFRNRAERYWFYTGKPCCMEGAISCNTRLLKSHHILMTWDLIKQLVLFLDIKCLNGQSRTVSHLTSMQIWYQNHQVKENSHLKQLLSIDVIRQSYETKKEWSPVTHALLKVIIFWWFEVL